MGKKNEKKASHENNVLDVIHSFFFKNNLNLVYAVIILNLIHKKKTVKVI